MPKDKASFKAGESVPVMIKSSGFTGVKIVAKDTATGREEELKATLVKSEGSGDLAPKMWNASWPTAGKKPGSYAFTVTGLGGSKATPVAKSVTFSVVQPSGPAKITFKEPAGGRQVKAGETVTVSVTATGVTQSGVLRQGSADGIGKDPAVGPLGRFGRVHDLMVHRGAGRKAATRSSHADSGRTERNWPRNPSP